MYRDVIFFYPRITLYEYLLTVCLFSRLELQVMSGDSYPLTLYWLNQQQPLSASVMAVLSPALQRQSLAESDVHQCTECGFQSEPMRWQCPQCESWETLCSRYESKIVQEQKKVG